MTTLVTGANGFIGSHVAKRLLERGESVRLLVREPDRLAAVGIDVKAPGLEIVVGDLLEPDTLRPALADIRRIHHIAGVISMGRADRQKMRELNVTTTRNLLEAVRGSQVERIVYLASIFALAGSTRDLVTENSPWTLSEFPVHYVQAKREAELYVRDCAERGMPIVFVYPTFCYGPGDVFESSSDLVLGFLRGRIPAYVNGGHNAIDVRDAAAGLIKAMDRGRIGERYIIGGENVRLDQMFELLRSITGRRGPRIKLPGKFVRSAARIAERTMRDPPMTEQIVLMSERFWYYDDAKARSEIGHTSRPLEQTIGDAVAWFHAERPAVERGSKLRS